jgi:hypothetical protein
MFFRIIQWKETVYIQFPKKMIEFVCEGILPYFLKEFINKNKSGI